MLQDQFSDLTGLRVLVVEDNPDNQTLYNYFLKSLGADFMIATSVCEAFALLTQFTPDILISDIALPDENGYSFIRKLRALEATSDQFLPAIAVSAYVQGNDDSLALAAGFQKWIPKPIELDSFITAIAQMVQQYKSSDRSGDSRKNRV